MLRHSNCPTCRGYGDHICSLCDGMGCEECPGRSGRFTCGRCGGEGLIYFEEDERWYGSYDPEPEQHYLQQQEERRREEIKRSVWLGELSLHEAVAALYNAAAPFMAGFFDEDHRKLVSGGEAKLWVQREDFLDYVNGRYMKVHIVDAQHINVEGYDRGYGVGTARMVLDAVRRGGPQAREIVDHGTRFATRNLLYALESGALIQVERTLEDGSTTAEYVAGSL